jgi:hypothetical protein
MTKKIDMSAPTSVNVSPKSCMSQGNSGASRRWKMRGAVCKSDHTDHADITPRYRVFQPPS